MNRRALRYFSFLGACAVMLLSATAGRSEENVVKAATAQPAPPVARGYITSAPAVSSPLLAYPNTAAYAPSYCTSPGCATSFPAPASYPAMARVDDQGLLMLRQTIVNPVTETQTLQVEAAGPNGEKVKTATPVVSVRYVAELQQRVFPFPYDVYRLDGTKLPDEEGRKLLKEEHAVVVASGAAQMAEVMSPLGRKLYRDDTLIIVVKNDAPPLHAAALGLAPSSVLPSARPVFAQPGPVPPGSVR